VIDAAGVARRRTRVAVSALLALIVVLVAIGIVSAHLLYTTSEDRYIKQAFPIRIAARDLTLQMVNEETSVRGYLITGDHATLQPYYVARPLAHADLAELERLTEGRPRTRSDLAIARANVQSLERYYDKQIALVGQSTSGQAKAQGDVVAGKERFDRFRAATGRLGGRAALIVQNAERRQRRTYHDALAIVIAAGAAAAAIGIGLLLFLPERMRRLYASEQEARLAAEQGARASLALEHVDAAVILFDRDGEALFLNRGANRMFGTGEVPDLAEVEEALARSGAGAVAPIATDDGQRLVAAAETRFADGRVLVLRDVTAEQELERARSDFIATASHELRTPLAAVYGAVRTLRRGDRPSDPTLDTQLLTMIEIEAERLRDIIEQILVSADLDRDAIRLNPQECDVRELCASVIASATMRTTNRFAFELDAPESLIVDCDPSRLRQVLVNLLDNAVKYSPEGGTINVVVRPAHGNVLIEVSDPGIGVPVEARERIFEKFFRVDPDMHRGVGGSGLGLFISRELIERMGGRLRVRATSGQGSTFAVELPVRT
jgi:signal transduction histidine kinase